MSQRKATPEDALSGSHLREAERGFLGILRSKGFPAAWIEANAVDLLAQASSEYVAWMRKHDAEENPVGWLITCAYRRALNLLEAQRRRPPAAALEDAAVIADEAASTPEQVVLDDERQSRLRSAVSCLPEKEQRLISYVYFEDCSIRDAGRRLGWRKSAADRHHKAALERLRLLVGDDRALLSPASLGLGAWVSVGEGGAGVFRRLGEGLRRLLPFAEPGTTALSGGAGRVLGACGAGAAAVACGLLAAGVQPSLPGGGEPAPARPTPAQVVARHPRPTPQRVPESPETPARATDSRVTPRKRSAERVAGSAPSHIVARPEVPPSSEPDPEPVAEEFGIEGGAEEAPATPAPTPKPLPPPAQEADGEQVSREFGL